MNGIFQVLFLLVSLALVLVSWAAPHPLPHPDGSETHPLPGPGLAYGGIPYGSKSGNVAQYFNKAATPNLYPGNSNDNYAPIERYLR